MRAAAAPWLAIVLPLCARHVTLGTDVCDRIKGVIACCEPFRLIRSHEPFWPDRDTVGDGFSRCPAPVQRFYNLLCMAYGSDPQTFGDLVDKGYLPQARAKGCRTEYGEARRAAVARVQRGSAAHLSGGVRRPG